MKTIFQFWLALLLVSTIDADTASAQTNHEWGYATVKGKISGNIPEEELGRLLTVNINSHIAIATESRFNVPIDKDGSFYLEIPVPVLAGSHAGFYSPLYWTGFVFKLYPDKESEILLHYDKNYEKRIVVIKSEGYSPEDASGLFWESIKLTEKECYGEDCSFDFSGLETAEAKRDYVLARTDEILNIIDRKSNLSAPAKEALLKEMKYFYAFLHLFQYSPDISYYSFLNKFDLNNPDIVYISATCRFMEGIFKYLLPEISEIDDTNPNIWLDKAKGVLSGLTGLNDGLFYDILLSNAYAIQLKSNKTFTEAQINNIRSYFGDNFLGEMLIAVNNYVISQNKDNEHLFVQGASVMDSLVSKYRGKVIVFDLWATWCAPCMSAMEKMVPLKDELKGKDVVFVYLTNGSSPKELWNEKIKEIGGEHYYLNGDEWESVMHSLGLEAIPSYLIYDASGKLKHKFTGYQGNDSMRKMITDLLK